MGEQKPPQSIRINMDHSTSFRDSLEIILKLDQKHRALGGSGFKMREVSAIKKTETSNSPYRVRLGTDSRQVPRIEDMKGAPHYKVEEVYQAILKNARSHEEGMRVCDYIKNKYSQAQWGDYLPFECIGHILQHREAFRDLLSEEDKRRSE